MFTELHIIAFSLSHYAISVTPRDVILRGLRLHIYTEEKAKVVAAVWGLDFIQFLAALAIWLQDDLKKRMKSSFPSYHPGAIHPFRHTVSSGCKIASAARNWIHSVPAAMTFSFSSVYPTCCFTVRSLPYETFRKTPRCSTKKSRIV